MHVDLEPAPELIDLDIPFVREHHPQIVGRTPLSVHGFVSPPLEYWKEQNPMPPLCLLELQLCKPSLFKEAQIWAMKLKLVSTIAYNWAIHLHVLMKRRWNLKNYPFLVNINNEANSAFVKKMSIWWMAIDSSQICTLGRWLLNKIRDLFV